MQGRMNIPVRGGGGEGVSLNVFAQATEPATKDGIWINTSATGSLPEISKFEYEGIEITKHDYYNKCSGSRYYLENTFAPFNIQYSIVVSLGTDIFIFGRYIGKEATKYSSIDDSYTNLKGMPNYHHHGCGAAYNGKIYLFGGDSNKKVDMYDPSTNTYTTLNDAPVVISNQKNKAIVVGNYIYLILLGNRNTQSMYRYDPSTDTYTQLSDVPYDARNAISVSMGSKIYIFGSYTNSNNRDKIIYVYDTVTDAYTKLENMPYGITNGFAEVIGNVIHIVSSNGSNNKEWTFDPTTNSCTNQISIPYNIYESIGTHVGEDIYILGISLSRNINIRSTTDITLRNKNIYIMLSSFANNAKLADNINIPVKDVYICDDNGLLKKYPVYYGDGTQWLPLAA